MQFLQFTEMCICYKSVFEIQIFTQLPTKYMQWDPPTLEKVSQDMVDHYFLSLSESEPDLELPTNSSEAFL